MKEQEKKAFKVVEKLKSIDLIVQEVESDAVFVNLDGWRMRVYFAEGFKGNVGKGTPITVGYRGDIENPHSVKFEKLK